MPRSGLRIIGGTWRGRRLPSPPGEAVRPTTDRVRETLFNWLAPVIEGVRCLDLYAGSGALGLEALSRGAAQVDFVERDAPTLRALGEVLDSFGASGQAQLHRMEAFQYLEGAVQDGSSWDVVFVDPPYGQGLVAASLERLPGLLSPDHRVYVEHEQDLVFPRPEGWQQLRESRAGQLIYRLMQFGDDP